MQRLLKTSLRLTSIVTLVLIVGATGFCSAQMTNTGNQEFVYSASPTPGGMVSSTYYPQTQQRSVLVTPRIAGNPYPAGVQPTTAPYTYPQTRLQPASFQRTVGYPQVAQQPADQIPTLGVPTPLRQPSLPPGSYNGAVIAPNQVAVPPAGSYQYPGCCGQPQYAVLQRVPQPVAPAVSFRNLPPGSYLGTGLVGQPKAYVDGQPIRNLFRFITP